ncbi:glutathione synthetase-like [Ylistrum balloti]|uniref:glutathione synthetase-like n=1 Tax=Ylistrum balloti TaxID=509963 RepID=UPI002905EF75|nr:glutathione synthetase-like [Ylistrum balloti]XP_060063121.1 glutathione synthetase-like [Ylistrum balloti]
MTSALNGISLDDKTIQNIITKTKHYALLHGVLIRSTDSPGDSEKVHYAPITLFPSLVPREALNKVEAIQIHFNKMMHMVAQDLDFLQKCLCNVIQVDDFNKRLWDIVQRVNEEGITQPISLGMFRSDYMMDAKHSTNGNPLIPTDPPTNGDLPTSASIPDNLQMKQIEFNMIATGSAGLISNVDKVHRFSLTLAGKKFDDSQIPANNPAHGMARGLVEGWKAYGNKTACVLFLVSVPELNTLDQRRLDLEMFICDTSIPIKYVTIKDMTDRGVLRKDKALIIDECEVAVVYFRTGYSPTHYSSEKDWDTRLMMERSKAIKCPSAQYQLAGTKKVQQELCRPGAVERFIKDAKVAHDIRETFVNQYSLDVGEDGDKALESAYANPQNYVIKTNREGGGNNTYDEDIKPLLTEIKNSKEERAKYIAMERIFPWSQTSYLLKAGADAMFRSTVTEIGVFGVYIGTDDKDIYNSVPGHVLRTKTADSNEGGLMVGLSYLDSPLLVD